MNALTISKVSVRICQKFNCFLILIMYDNNIINVLILQVLPNVDIDTPEPSSISWVSPNTSNTNTAEFTQESKQVKVITRRNEL